MLLRQLVRKRARLYSAASATRGAAANAGEPSSPPPSPPTPQRPLQPRGGVQSPSHHLRPTTTTVNNPPGAFTGTTASAAGRSNGKYNSAYSHNDGGSRGNRGKYNGRDLNNNRQQQQQQGFGPTPKETAKEILDLGSQGEWEKIRYILHLTRNTPSAIVLDAAISAAQRCGRWQDALKLMGRMNRAGLCPSMISYRSTISVCCREGRYVIASRLLSEMNQLKRSLKWQGGAIMPDVASYNALMAVYARAGLYQQAVDLFNNMMAERQAFVQEQEQIEEQQQQQEAGQANHRVQQMMIQKREQQQRKGQRKERDRYSDKHACMHESLILKSYTIIMSACVKAQQYEIAVKLLWDIEKQGFYPNEYHYATALDAHVKAGKVDDALSLLADLKSTGYQPDVVLYNTVLAACVYRSSRTVITTTTGTPIFGAGTATVPTTNIGTTATDHTTSGASTIDNGTRTRENENMLNTDDVTESQLNNSKGDNSGAIISTDDDGDYYSSSSSSSKSDSTSNESNVMQRFAGKSGSELAMHLFTMMQQEGVIPDVISYSTIISVLGVEGRYLEALKLLEDMIMRGISPNAFTYAGVISAAANAGRDDYAVELLQEMISAGITPNVFCFSAAMSACAKNGKYETAKALLADMQKYGVKPNVVCYTAVIHACSAAGAHDDAVALVAKLMNSQNNRDSGGSSSGDGGGSGGPRRNRNNPRSPNALRHDHISYMVAVEALAKAGRLDDVLNLLQEVQKEFQWRHNIQQEDIKSTSSNIASPLLTSSSLSPPSCLATSQLVGGGEAAAGGGGGDAVTTASTPIVDNFSVLPYYNTAFSCFSSTSQHEMVLQLFDVMKQQHGIEGNAMSYNYAISSCVRCGQHARALPLLREMQAMGLRADVHSYSAAISAAACVNGKDTSSTSLDLSRDADNIAGSNDDDVDEQRHGDDCSSGERGGDGDSTTGEAQALALLQEMQDRGLRANTACFTAAMDACGQAGQVGKILELVTKAEVEVQNGGRTPKMTGAGGGGRGGGANRHRSSTVDMMAVYETAITALDKRGAYSEVDQLYSRARARNILNNHWSAGCAGSVMDLQAFTLPLAKAAIRHSIEVEKVRGDMTVVTGQGKDLVCEAPAALPVSRLAPALSAFISTYTSPSPSSSLFSSLSLLSVEKEKSEKMVVSAQGQEDDGDRLIVTIQERKEEKV